MFWRMAGLSSASAVDFLLDKENFTLEDLLDEDEVIQECKALNTRLINFMKERAQVEKLIYYVVEEPPEDAEEKRVFKFPFIACEIFTCEVDSILDTLVDDEELMNMLFSFLRPDHPHSTLLAGYFSKVVVCLMLRKTAPFMDYIQSHQDIFCQLVDLIGITSIMEVLIRLIGADENMYNNLDAMRWLDETSVLDMILDKLNSSDSPEVHANAAETLCAITRYASPAIASKIANPSYVQRLLKHALEVPKSKSVLVHSLSICISLLDPKRSSLSPYHHFRVQQIPASAMVANPEAIEGMLGSIGDLLKLLDVSSSSNILQTTYGKLQPPLEKHRLKIVEFISVLLTVGNEAAEMEMVKLGAIKRIINLFFEYPFNNFLHTHVENIIVSCLESKRSLLIDHVLSDCDLVGKILEAEAKNMLSHDSNKPTVPAEGKLPPRIGNIGHLTRISNKLVQLGNTNSQIQQYLQGKSEWRNWHSNVLIKRNAVENVYQWACGRPSALQDRVRDSDDEDLHDRDYDVAALASNLSQAFRYGIFNQDKEGHASLEQDDEDVYFDDESAEVVISSLRLGDDHDSGSLYTNSNWFAFEDGANHLQVNERTSHSLPSTSQSADQSTLISRIGGVDFAVGGENGLISTPCSSMKPPPSEIDLTGKQRAETKSQDVVDGDEGNGRLGWSDLLDTGSSSVLTQNGKPEAWSSNQLNADCSLDSESTTSSNGNLDENNCIDGNSPSTDSSAMSGSVKA